MHGGSAILGKTPWATLGDTQFYNVKTIMTAVNKSAFFHPSKGFTFQPFSSSQ
jgi:hypothetical protein